MANLIDSVEFVITPLIEHMTRQVQYDTAVGLDDTSCRMLLPRTEPTITPGDERSVRLAAKVAEAKAKGHKSVMAKMWAYSGLNRAPYNIFDFRVSRHRDGPDEFFRRSRCTVFGDCFSGNTSVILANDDRLRFAACWAHPVSRPPFPTRNPTTAQCEPVGSWRNVTCGVEHFHEPQRPAPIRLAVAAWDWSAVGNRLGGSDPVRMRFADSCDSYDSWFSRPIGDGRGENLDTRSVRVVDIRR